MPTKKKSPLTAEEKKLKALEILNTGVCEDTKRIMGRIAKNGIMPDFHPNLTVTAEGVVTGNYWQGLENYERRLRGR